MWGGPSHAKLQHAEHQAHGHANQLPWRRGRLGIVIPAVTLGAFAVAAIIYLIAA